MFKSKTQPPKNYANKGRAFEDLIEFANAQYRRQSIAVVGKQNTKFLPIRNGQGQLVSAKVEEKATVDYLGRYRNIPVAVEAKHTEGTRIAFSRVEPHQADYMDDFCKDDGAIGIVLVSFSLNRFFAVPWPFWKAARDAWVAGKGKTKIQVEAYGWKWETTGMASTTAEQLLPEWEIKTGGRSGLPYLEIIDRMERGVAG
jgi:recombination protein U